MLGRGPMGAELGETMADEAAQLDLFGEFATGEVAKPRIPPIDHQRTATRMGLKAKQVKAQLMGVDPFEYLLVRFAGAEESDEKDELAFQLMPYLKPKIRSVEIKGGGAPVNFVVTIGGDDLGTGGE